MFVIFILCNFGFFIFYILCIFYISYIFAIFYISSLPIEFGISLFFDVALNVNKIDQKGSKGAPGTARVFLIGVSGSPGVPSTSGGVRGGRPPRIKVRLKIRNIEMESDMPMALYKIDNYKLYIYINIYMYIYIYIYIYKIYKIYKIWKLYKIYKIWNYKNYKSYKIWITEFIHNTK